MTYKQKLLTTQVYIHIIFLVGLFLLPWYIIIPTIVISQIVYAGLCGTVFFHRVSTHKNSINPTIEKCLILLSWLGATSSALAWSGVHRKHHRFSDTEKDPHSPIFIGKFRTYWQLSNNDKDIIRYVPDLLRKPWYVFQHRHYFAVLYSIHILGLILLPLPVYWMLLIVPAFLMWFSGSMINCFCHNEKGPMNNVLLSVLMIGEGMHKNHHAEPANPSFQHTTDMGYKIYNLIK
jgi:stearoyl-CoA desaturase (delta-9 desaturase)